MRIGFVTCVEIGLQCLEEISRLGGHVDHVFTLNDHLSAQKSGRVYLDEICEASNWPLTKIDHVRDAATLTAVRDADLDWLFIVGWSQIAPPELLSIPRLGCIGMHPTLLPMGRGNAAIPWAILKGLDRTGVTMFQLDAGVDTGPIIEAVEIALEPLETASSLYEKSLAAHRELIRTVWPLLQEGRVSLTRQDESQATIWPRRRPADGCITAHMSVEEASRMVRALGKPYPGAFWLQDNRKLIIWDGTATEPDPTAPGSNAPMSIELEDGRYWATEYEWIEATDQPG